MTDQEILPDYKIFETAHLYSPQSEAVERAVIARAFRLNHLKYLSKGPRKHHVDFANFGMWPPDSVEQGAFELAVTVQAVETFRRFEFFRAQGMWTTFDNPNPLTGRLRETSIRIGKSLGWTVRIWNDLGHEWPDLFHHFGGRHAAPVPRWEPFLAFYALFQTARRGMKREEKRSIAEAIIAAMLAETSGRATAVLADEAPLCRLLRAAGVAEESIDELRVLHGQWTRLRGNRATWFAAVAKRSDRPAADIPPPIRNVIRDHRLQPIVETLHEIGVRFESSEELSDSGDFDVLVRCEGASLRVIPRIRLRRAVSRADYDPKLVLAHEIGHFFVNFGWKMEISLANVIVDFLDTKRRADPVRLLNLKDEAYHEMVRFHSAIETTADEVAVEILLPDEKIKAIYEKCLVGEDEFSWVHFQQLVRAGLGVPASSGRWERLELIVRDRAPETTFPSRLLTTGKDLRNLRYAASSQRVEELLERFWEEMLAIVGTR